MFSPYSVCVFFIVLHQNGVLRHLAYSMAYYAIWRITPNGGLDGVLRQNGIQIEIRRYKGLFKNGIYAFRLWTNMPN